jgi:hypothetical protein
MLSNMQLAYCLGREYPGTQNGVEYMTGHPLGEDGEQSGPAFLAHWKLPGDKPDDAAIAALWEKWKADFALDRAAADIRNDRDERLAKADDEVNKALDSGDDARLARARAYRQALRDVPQQPGFPVAVSWPLLS